MPLVECVLIKGYNNTTRKILAERITDAACSAIGAAPEFVTVTISEVDSDNYMRGRTQRTPSVAPMQPLFVFIVFKLLFRVLLLVCC